MDKPFAHYIESKATPGECWELIEGREPTEYVGDNAFTISPLYLSTTPARAEAQSDDLRTACQAVLDDYQTSDAHHPDHVLIRRTGEKS